MASAVARFLVLALVAPGARQSEAAVYEPDLETQTALLTTRPSRGRCDVACEGEVTGRPKLGGSNNRDGGEDRPRRECGLELEVELYGLGGNARIEGVELDMGLGEEAQESLRVYSSDEGFALEHEVDVR